MHDVYTLFLSSNIFLYMLLTDAEEVNLEVVMDEGNLFTGGLDSD